MNLLKLVQILQTERIPLEGTYGADFSEPMVAVAEKEVDTHLPQTWRPKVHHVVARNERLREDMAKGLNVAPPSLDGKFDLMLVANTFRYCHRLKMENICARDLLHLLRPGGYSIIIDMNRHFPFVRSRLRNALTRVKHEVLHS